MGLFGKKNSVQKHTIIEVIEYGGPNDVLIWKFPNEDFNTNTQLIVRPAQEAIFVKGGQIMGRFQSGTYTLDTKNYPFIRSLVGLVTGGVSPFSCTVYYVNKVVSMGIDWGTDAPISIVDPVYRVPTDICSYGDFSLQVDNGQKLLEKLVGQTQGYTHEEIKKYFTNMMATQVRSVISRTMLEKGLSPIGIDAHLDEMSVVAAEKLRPLFEPYGLSVNHFTITSITAPQLDALKKQSYTLQAHRMNTDINVEDKRKFAQAQAFENQELGINEQQKMVGRAMETLAQNPGPAVFGGGVAINGIAGGNIVQSSAPSAVKMADMLMNHQPPQQPTRTSDENPAKANSQEDFEQRAKKVKYLYESGMITQEQYQQKIDQLMNEI